MIQPLCAAVPVRRARATPRRRPLPVRRVAALAGTTFRAVRQNPADLPPSRRAFGLRGGAGSAPLPRSSRGASGQRPLAATSPAKLAASARSARRQRLARLLQAPPVRVHEPASVAAPACDRRERRAQLPPTSPLRLVPQLPCSSSLSLPPSSSRLTPQPSRSTPRIGCAHVSLARLNSTHPNARGIARSSRSGRLLS